MNGCPRLEADGSYWPGVTRRAGPARRSSRAIRTTSCSACSTRRTPTPSPLHPWTTPSRSALCSDLPSTLPSAFCLPPLPVASKHMRRVEPCCCSLALVVGHTAPGTCELQARSTCHPCHPCRSGAWDSQQRSSHWRATSRASAASTISSEVRTGPSAVPQKVTGSVPCKLVPCHGVDSLLLTVGSAQ